MVKLLSIEKIPEWAICPLFNGDRDDLGEEERKALLDWQNEMIKWANEEGKNFAGLDYCMHDGDNAEPYFTNCPAFGPKNPNALTRCGESPYLACDVYDVDIYAIYND